MSQSIFSKSDLLALYAKYEHDFREIKSMSLSLDMTRGKPSSEQLDLSNNLDGILNRNYTTPSGIDVRNYGGLEGLPEAKSLFAQVLEVETDEIIIGGNSSLTMMYQFIDLAFHHGLKGKDSAWRNISTPTFLCPVPGYDRHFAICEFLGIKMIPVPLLEDGPDLEVIKELIAKDKNICGMWCVPKYSNPSGVVYSEKCIRELVSIVKNARPEFRVLWDNAYAIHDLIEDHLTLSPVLNLAKEAGTEDSFILFGSTSKITQAGAGVAFAGMSKSNHQAFRNYLSFQTIGPDKVNQFRHTSLFSTFEDLKSHMAHHANILRPRFEAVIKNLENELGDKNFASWTSPKGGYFVSVDTLPGLAKEAISICNELGVKITPAGSTFPYGNDPEDKNIRLAPSFPSVDQINLAMKAFTTAVGIASVKKLLG